MLCSLLRIEKWFAVSAWCRNKTPRTARLLLVARLLPLVRLQEWLQRLSTHSSQHEVMEWLLLLLRGNIPTALTLPVGSFLTKLINYDKQGALEIIFLNGKLQ